jgi:thiamine-phosphate pyrophosphorylase
VNRLSNSYPLIYLITDGTATDADFGARSAAVLQLIEAAVSAEIPLVQLREKQISVKLLFELAGKAAAITKNTGTRLLVNDRADVALAAGADGVHLTAGSLPAEKIVRGGCFPPEFVVGVSTHSVAEVERAKRQKADFAVYGPVFATPSKIAHGAPQGPEKLAEAVAAAGEFPVIALGGVDADNFRLALDAGAKGVAGIRLFGAAENLGAVAARIRASGSEFQL